MSVLVDARRMADRRLNATCADEANGAVPVFVEVGRRQRLCAGAVFEGDARHEDRQRNGRSLGHRAKEKRDLHELGAVRVNIST